MTLYIQSSYRVARDDFVPQRITWDLRRWIGLARIGFMHREAASVNGVKMLVWLSGPLLRRYRVLGGYMSRIMTRVLSIYENSLDQELQDC